MRSNYDVTISGCELTRSDYDVTTSCLKLLRSN